MSKAKTSATTKPATEELPLNAGASATAEAGAAPGDTSTAGAADQAADADAKAPEVTAKATPANDNVKAPESMEKSAEAVVLCHLANASASINGIEFTPVELPPAKKGGAPVRAMRSAAIPREVAEKFATIDGYEIEDESAKAEVKAK